MRILLIHTGGTIGMVETEQGFAPREGVLEHAVAKILSDWSEPPGSRPDTSVRPEVQIEALTPLVDSAFATPSDWNRIVGEIARARETFDGVVVSHGTDTLAYTTSALCMALVGVDLPVIVTGAMLPLSVAGSDGWRNLEDALRAAQTAAPGVWVQFAGSLMPGGRVRKSHSSALDAFTAVQCEKIPRIDAAEFEAMTVMTGRVAVFSIVPGFCADLLAHLVENCDGLVLRCYGSGTAPDTPGMREALSRARESAVPVVAVSQCSEGGIKLGTYAAGQVMRDTDVIDGRDMTPEMAYVKLQYALSRFDDFAAQRDFLGTCQCGEFSPA